MIQRKYYPTIVLSDIHQQQKSDSYWQQQQTEWNIVSYSKEEYEAEEVASSVTLYATVV